MTDLIQHPYAQALAWALVHFVWQGAAIAGAVFVLLRSTRMSATTRYGIGVVALAAMLVAPVVTFARLAGRLSVATPAGSLAADFGATPAAAFPMPGSVALVRPSGPTVGSRGPAEPAGALGPTLLLTLLAAWCVGVAFFSLRLLGGWVVAQRLARRAIRPVAPEIQMLARRVAGRLALDRIVSVFESGAVSVPMMVGWLKPAVLLPAAALAGLAPMQIEALLAHELAHVRRHDYLVNLLQSMVETLLFYHPAVWWLSRWVRAEREHCCDDLALAVCDRLVYATALADLASMPTPRLMLAATDGSLVGRVRRILGRPGADLGPPSGWLPMSCVVLVVGALIPIGLVSARAPDRAPQSQGALKTSPGVPEGVVVAGVPGGVGGGVPKGIVAGKPGGVREGVPNGVVAGVAGGVARGVGGVDEPRAEAVATLSYDLAPLKAKLTSSLPQDPALVAAGSGLGFTEDQAASATAAPAGEQTQSGSGNFIWSNNGDKVAIKWTGAFRLSDDDKDIAWVEPGKTVQVSDGGWLLSTGVEVKGLADGKPEHTYYRHGFVQAYEPDGREFLAAALQRAIRSGIGASSRVARFLKQGNVNAVFAEIDKLDGDYVRGLYYREVLKQAELSQPDLMRVVTRASETMTSDYELTSLLITAAKQAKGDEATLVTLADATKTIRSDYERHRMLSAVMADRLSPKVAAAILRNVTSIQSDYERASLLVELVKKGGLTSETKDAFFTRVSEMRSAFEQSRVLKAVTETPNLSADVATDMLKASTTMSSDYGRRQVLSAHIAREPMSAQGASGVLAAAGAFKNNDERATVLLQFAKKGGVTGDTAASFFSLVGGMTSSYEQRRVIDAIAVQPGLPDSVLASLLKAAATITGDNDRAEVLIGVAKRQVFSQATRALYLAAADGIRSDYDQTRVLAQLVRSERIRRQ